MRIRALARKTRQIQQIRLSYGVLLFNVGRLTEGWVSWPGWAKWPRPRLVKIGILCKEFFFWSGGGLPPHPKETAVYWLDLRRHALQLE